MKPELKRSKEGLAAAYGYDKLYKIQAVSEVAPLSKTSSGGARDDGRQKKPANKSFHAVFVEEMVRQEDGEIYLYTNGYTKDAVNSVSLIYKREYTHRPRLQL
jgi:hypothetical protein